MIEPRRRGVPVPNSSHRAMLAATLSVSLPLLLAGCKDDTTAADDGGDDQAQDEGEDSQVSGFTSGNGSGSGGTGGSAGDETAGTAGTAAGVPEEPELPDWEGTGFIGELHIALGFTYVAASSLVAEDQVGIAAAYRTADEGWDGLEDFYSPVVYQYAFPAVPEEDTTSQDGPVPAFEWGSETDWILAGPALRLHRGLGGPTITACLVNLFPTEDNPTGYPLYQTLTSMEPQCIPDAEAWEPRALYDLELLGGDRFESNYLFERIETPRAINDLSLRQDGNNIDIDTLGAQVDSTLDLRFEWNGPGSGADTRIVIRLVDGDNNLVTAHAADDGDYTIAASDLEALNPGTLDVLVSRERTDRLIFTDGGIRAVSRYERWGFLEIF